MTADSAQRGPENNTLKGKAVVAERVRVGPHNGKVLVGLGNVHAGGVVRRVTVGGKGGSYGVVNFDFVTEVNFQLRGGVKAWWCWKKGGGEV